MIEKELNAGSACFLIKDKRLIGDWCNTPIYNFIQEEGFFGIQIDWDIILYGNE